MLEIDRKLNLVFPIERPSGAIYVHSMPISREVFERYFITISKVFAAIYGEGLNIIAGPRIAALMLRKIAQDTKTWEGTGGVQQGLVNEVYRLTNVVMPVENGNGWTTLPFHIALQRKLLSEDDIAEVDGVLIFFMCVSAMHLRSELPAILAGTALWGAQTSSLNATEYAGSLPTLTTDGTSQKPVPV